MVLPAAPEESIVVQRMRLHKLDILARDGDTLLHMGNRWLRLENTIEANIQILSLDMLAAAEKGETITRSALFRRERYQKLVAQIRDELTDYNVWADEFITQNQRNLGKLGIEHAADALQGSLMEGGQAGMFFDKLPVSAIENMVGIAGDGGPLQTLLQQAYPTAVDRMTDVLVKNTALGINPRQTARELIDGTAEELNHSLKVARTEQLRVYREASRQQYETSGLVQSYRRLSAKNANTCAVCLALDGEIYPTDELMHVHPNCVIGETPVLAPDTIAGITASYSGPIIEFTTSEGRMVSVTPNHMLLTSTGFVRAKDIREGNNVLYCPDFERIVNGDPNNNNGPSMIKNVISAFAETGGMMASRVPVSPEYLHGDASLMDGYIDIVAPYGFLGSHGQAAVAETVSQKDFGATDTKLATLIGEGDLATMLLALGLAARGNVRGVGISSPFFGGSFANHQSISVGASPDFDAILRETPMDNRTTSTEVLSQSVLGLASQVPITNKVVIDDGPSRGLDIDSDLFKPTEHGIVGDPNLFSHVLRSFSGKITETEIVDIRYFDFSGHVYDLQTQSSLYLANGLVSSNCRCTMVPVVAGMPRIEWETGEEWLKKQDPEVREQILGKSASDMLDDGVIELKDLVQKTEHDIWGPSLQRTPLKDLDTGIMHVHPEAESLSGRFSYRSSKASVHFDNAIEDLDSVFVDMADLDISVAGYSGRGEGKFNPDTGKIQINNSAQHPELSFVHETGHAMDYRVLPGAIGIEGKTATLGSAFGSTPMDDFWGAIDNSDAIKKLQAMKLDDPSGMAYLLDVREVHARAFSQYVAETSGSQILMGQLDEVREFAWYPEQWTKKDFAPIKKAMDNLYGGAGLLR